MMVIVYFGQDWAGHEAHSLAEVSESLAEALVGAGVALAEALVGAGVAPAQKRRPR